MAHLNFHVKYFHEIILPTYISKKNCQDTILELSSVMFVTVQTSFLKMPMQIQNYLYYKDTELNGGLQFLYCFPYAEVRWLLSVRTCRN